MPGDDGRIPSSIDRLDVQLDLADLHSNRFGLDTVLTGLFPGKDKRATTSSSPLEARSESVIAINPLNELNMVGASKKFIDPANYHFMLGPDLHLRRRPDVARVHACQCTTGWDGMTDPTVAFDDFGHAFLVGEPLTTPRPHRRARHGCVPLVRRRSHLGAAVPAAPTTSYRRQAVGAVRQQSG